jgi:hypothetical protein
MGQTSDGSACGAAVGALKHCCAHDYIPNAEYLGSHPADYQMQFLISEIDKRKDVILSKANDADKQAELVKQMYLIVKVTSESSSYLYIFVS